MMDATDQPLKILMIAPTSFFGDYGGHIRILEETLALERLGHKVAIVTYYKGRDLDGIDIRRTAPLPYRTEYEVGSSRHKFAFDIYLMWQALLEAWRMRPDIIHGHMHEGVLIGWVLSLIFRRPLIFDFQGSLTGEMVDHGFLKKETKLFRLFRRLERFICERPDRTFTSSLRAQQILERDFGVAADKIVPLPDCVDLERFNPAAIPAERTLSLKRRLRIPEDRPVIAYLGFMAPHQGTDVLIQTAVELKAMEVEAHMLIMGFPNVNQYRQLAKQLGVADRIRFTGRVKYDEAPRFLSVGDVTISPKLSLTEGSGKVLNYMAMSKPVVASNNPVHQEYLGELGIYTPLRDATALANEIAALLAKPKEALVMGEALRERARQKYSWTRAAQLIESVYRGLLK